MAHYVLFFGSTAKRSTTAATFETRKAAEKHARDWGYDQFAVGQVTNIKRFKAKKESKR